MKKGIKIILSLVVIALMVVVGLFFAEDKLQTPAVKSETPVPIVLTMYINAERPFNAQVFWTEDEADKFNEKQSVRKQVKAGYSSFELLIPTDIVHRFRFDFGQQPGKVLVKNIHLSGLTPVTLDVNQFTFSNDIATHEVVDDALMITSDEKDPYAVYKYAVDVVSD